MKLVRFSKTNTGHYEFVLSGDEAGAIGIIDALMMGGEMLGVDDGLGKVLDDLATAIADLTGLVHTRGSWMARRKVAGIHTD